MTRLDDVASKDITADQITGEDAPAPAPAPEVQMSTDCYVDPRTEDALNGKFDKCWEWENDGRGISCIYLLNGCKKYDCKTPEDCASLGGENHGKHNHHSGALAWSTGFAAVTVAASTVAFL